MTTTPTTPSTATTPDARPGVLPPLTHLGKPGLLTIAGLLLLRTVLLFAGDGISFGIVRAGSPEAGWNDAIIWSNVAIVAVDIITVIVVALALRRGGSSLGALLKPRSVGKDIGWGLLMGLIAIIGFYIATFIGNLIAYLGPPPMPEGEAVRPALWFGLWCLIVMPITIAVAEEVLYRGYLQSALSARWGKVAGLLITAAFFGLQHLALSPADPQAWLARWITTFAAGVMFGLLAWWMKRLWPLIIGHWLLDVIGLGLPIFIASLGA